MDDVWCEFENFDRQHQCTNPAPTLEAQLPGTTGNRDEHWAAVCVEHMKGQTVRLNFNATQELWGEVADCLEQKADMLAGLGFGPTEIKAELERAIENAMLHSEYFD